MITKIVSDGDIVYVLDRIQAPRGMGKSKKADEVLIYGFSQKAHPGLLEKILKDLKEGKIK